MELGAPWVSGGYTGCGLRFSVFPVPPLWLMTLNGYDLSRPLELGASCVSGGHGVCMWYAVLGALLTSGGRTGRGPSRSLASS